jgi:hypothetical protein
VNARSVSASAALNSAGLLATALGSATQVALLLGRFGATHRTDGVIVALAVYSLVSVAGQMLRTTAVRLLIGSGKVMTPNTFGWAITVLVSIITVLGVVFAGPLAGAVAGSSGATAQATATTALRIMAPAMSLQVAGAALAVVSGVRGRFGLAAGAYVLAALAGVGTYLTAVAPTGVQALSWANVASAVVLCTALLVGMRIRFSKPPSPSVIMRAAAALVHDIPLPISFVIMYPITLALAPKARAGDVTLYGLAYTACSYLPGITAQALSMASMSTFVSLDAGDMQARLRGVISAFRYSLVLAVPILAVVAVAGAPLVALLVAHRAGAGGTSFGTYAALLGPFLVASLAVWAVLPAVLSSTLRPQGWRMVATTGGLLLLHAAATVCGRLVAGFDGAVVAMAVAPAAFAVVGLSRVIPGALMHMVRPATVVCTITVLSFGLLDLGAHDITSAGTAAGILTAAIALIVYGALVSATYANEARALYRLATRRL